MKNVLIVFFLILISFNYAESWEKDWDQQTYTIYPSKSNYFVLYSGQLNPTNLCKNNIGCEVTATDGSLVIIYDSNFDGINDRTLSQAPTDTKIDYKNLKNDDYESCLDNALCVSNQGDEISTNVIGIWFNQTISGKVLYFMSKNNAEHGYVCFRKFTLELEIPNSILENAQIKGSSIPFPKETIMEIEGKTKRYIILNRKNDTFIISDKKNGIAIIQECTNSNENAPLLQDTILYVFDKNTPKKDIEEMVLDQLDATSMEPKLISITQSVFNKIEIINNLDFDYPTHKANVKFALIVKNDTSEEIREKNMIVNSIKYVRSDLNPPIDKVEYNTNTGQFVFDLTKLYFEEKKGEWGISEWPFDTYYAEIKFQNLNVTDVPRKLNDDKNDVWQIDYFPKDDKLTIKIQRSDSTKFLFAVLLVLQLLLIFGYYPLKEIVKKYDLQNSTDFESKMDGKLIELGRYVIALCIDLLKINWLENLISIGTLSTIILIMIGIAITVRINKNKKIPKSNFSDPTGVI